jgi:hypothetical protein
MEACEANDCCGGVATKRAEAKRINGEYNDLIVAHGPHKDNCNEAKTYLGIYTAVSAVTKLLVSALMFIYAKIKKSLKAVELIAQWAAGAGGLTLSAPRKGKTAGYLRVPVSPIHHLGSQKSLWVTSGDDLLVSSDTVMILGIGTETDPTGEAFVPNTSKGKVAIVGMEEVRVTSPGDCEVAAMMESRMSGTTVDILADLSLKLTAKSRLSVPGAKMDLLSDDTTTITSEKMNVEITTTVGDIVLDGKKAITLATLDYKLDAKASATLTAKVSLDAKGGEVAELRLSADGAIVSHNSSNGLNAAADSVYVGHSGQGMESKPDETRIIGPKVTLQAPGMVNVSGAKITLG